MIIETLEPLNVGNALAQMSSEATNFCKAPLGFR